MRTPHEQSDASDRTALIDCETAVKRLWDFLDGRLPAISRAEVESHLAVCERCPSHFAFASTVQRSIAASAPVRSDADDERLARRVRDALRRHGETPDTRPNP